MSHAARVVCRPEIAAGFRLAGLRAVDAASPEDGAARTVELAEAPDVGLILVEEPCFAALSETARATLARRALPVIIPFPAPAAAAGEPARAEDYLVEILRQAIGYRVRLK